MSTDTSRTLPTAKLSSTRLEFLDGLRALAALWVLLGHAHLFALGWNAIHTPLGYPSNILLYLGLAVNIFLVLSGFCLALPVVRNGNRLRESIPRFLQKRCLRILPPYYATLILILIVNWFVPISAWGRHPAGLTPTLSAPVFWTNGFLLQDIYPQYNVINGPFWSISVEWHIYFFFPLIVWGLRRFGPVAPLLGCALAAVGLTWLSHQIPIIAPWYIALFGMGVVGAWFAFHSNDAKRQAQIFRSAWIIAAVFSVLTLAVLVHYRIENGQSVPRFENHRYIIDPITGVVTAALLVGLCGLSETHPVRRILAWRPLVLLGGFSYSLYLTHIPIEAALYEFTVVHGFAQSNPKLTFYALCLVGGAICIGFAWIFSRIFEIPFLPGKRRSSAGSPTGIAPVAVAENV